MTILESTLNCQNLIGDDLELCEPCKNTIIPFYLLKLKLDEANQLPETRKKYREQSIDLLATNETDQISFVKLEAMEDVSCEESVDGWQETSFAEPKKKKSRPNQYDWVEKKVFQNSDEATEFIKAQKIWSVKNTKPPCKNGEKRQYYRCNQVPRSQSHQCPCVATLVTKSDGSIVFLQTTEAHDHSQM